MAVKSYQCLALLQDMPIPCTNLHFWTCDNPRTEPQSPRSGFTCSVKFNSSAQRLSNWTAHKWKLRRLQRWSSSLVTEYNITWFVLPLIPPPLLSPLPSWIYMCTYTLHYSCWACEFLTNLSWHSLLSSDFAKIWHKLASGVWQVSYNKAKALLSIGSHSMHLGDFRLWGYKKRKTYWHKTLLLKTPVKVWGRSKMAAHPWSSCELLTWLCALREAGMNEEALDLRRLF